MVEGPAPLDVRPATAAALAPLALLHEEGRDAVPCWADASPSELRLRHDAGRIVQVVQRLPDARRWIRAQVDYVLLLVREGRPEAWRIQAGRTVLLERGTWHAEPVPLGPGAVRSAVEPLAAFDRMDRSTLAELTDTFAVGLRVPDAPPRPRPAPPPGATDRGAAAPSRSDRHVASIPAGEAEPARAAHGAPRVPARRRRAPTHPSPPSGPIRPSGPRVEVERLAAAVPSRFPPADPAPAAPVAGPRVGLSADFRGRVHVSAFVVALAAGDLGPPVRHEEDLEAWSARLDTGEGARREARARSLARDLDLADPYETPRQQVLRSVGRRLGPCAAWQAALWLASLEEEVDLLALDADRLGPSLWLDRGREGETAPRPSGHRLGLVGDPVLRDRGRPVAALGGVLSAGAVHPRSRRLAVFAFLPGLLRPREVEGRVAALAERLGR